MRCWTFATPAALGSDAKPTSCRRHRRPQLIGLTGVHSTDASSQHSTAYRAISRLEPSKVRVSSRRSEPGGRIANARTPGPTRPAPIMRCSPSTRLAASRSFQGRSILTRCNGVKGSFLSAPTIAGLEPSKDKHQRARTRRRQGHKTANRSERSDAQAGRSHQRPLRHRNALQSH